MTEIESLFTRYDSLIVKRDFSKQKLREMKKNILHGENKIENLYEAQYILQEAATLVQNEMILHITEISNLCLSAIFDDPYTVEIDFQTKRNQSEAYIYLRRGEMYLEPMNSVGGGVVDVVSFALRLSLWSLNKDKSAPILFFDEPFKNLSRNLQESTQKILEKVCLKLRLQLVMVTHVTAFIGNVDNVIKLKKNGSRTKEEK